MEATQTIDYAIEKLQPVFDKLGELGVAGWEIAVRQQVVEGALSLFLSFVLLVTALVLIRWAVKKAASTDPEDEKPYGYISHSKYDEAPRATFFVALAGNFALLIGLIYTVCTFSSSVARVLNPQWAAIQALMSLVN
jgi:hypothetical protein